MISVLILTKNEERDLPGCLASVRWSDDVHVLDSFSTDRTLEVAREAGAIVTQHTFEDWASQKNWALTNLPWKYPWVFCLDADERVTPELARSLAQAAAAPAGNVAFRVQRRDFFLGRWLKHVQATPFYVRLFRPEKMRYERPINEITMPDGPVGEVAGYLDHFPFSKGIDYWVARHNLYSTMEARQIVADRAAQRPVSIMKALTASRIEERRVHQKELFYRMPFRPLAKFLLLYLAKGGFLDGRAGLTYAILQSFYEYMIVVKTRELIADQQRGGSQKDPAK